MKTMLVCRSAVDLLSDLLDGEATFWQRMSVRGHLAMCSKCRSYFRQFQRIYELCGRVQPSQLPDDFEEVMGKVLQGWRSGS